MESHRDKSADLFALTTRFMSCLQPPNALARSSRLLHIQENRLETGATARVDRAALRLRARFARSRRGRSGNPQVCADAADAAGGEPCELWALNIQVQPNEQPIAKGFGAEAA